MTQLFESLNRLDLSAADGVDLKHITQQADDESLLQLSGVYHNLLRRWSDV